MLPRFGPFRRRISPTLLALAISSLPVRAEVAPDLQRWAFVPIVISTAETGVQGGALVMRFLNPGDTLNKSSTIGLAARISQKKQAQLNLFPEWYLRNNLYHVDAEVNYIRWPAYYYGTGNHTDIPQDSADAYFAHGVNGELTVERKLLQKWLQNFSAGPQAIMNYETIDPKGHHRLLTESVTGWKGGFLCGLGGLMTYDGRDAIYWTRAGTFLRAKAAWYQRTWGSEFDFDSYKFEARQFLPLFSTGAVGVSALLQIESGQVPFRELSTADGDHNLRGIVRGKYRDRDLLVLQSEYKSYLPDYSWLRQGWIRNRLGYAVFAEAGQVAHEVGDIAWKEFRYGYGVGLRYAMNPAQRMNIRVDAGYVDATVALAINIKEAF